MTISRDPQSFSSYQTDASNFKGCATELCVPHTINEVVQAVRDYGSRGTPMTVSGNGTGLCGGRVASEGAILSLEQLRRISIDATSRVASVQAGISMQEFQDETLSKGLLYPPDPTEWSAALGGTWGTNASGARTYKYGATRSYVNSIHVVLSDAEELVLQRGECVAYNGNLQLSSRSGKLYDIPVPSVSMPNTSKHAAGYYTKNDLDAVDLFIGSEGTLGIMVEAELRLLPAPERVLGMIIFFDDVSRLLDTVEILRASKGSDDLKSPRLVEFFDRRALNFIATRYPDIPADTQATLWIEQEYSASQENEVFEAWLQFISKQTLLHEETWFATDDRRHRELRAFRHALPSAIYEDLSTRKQTKIGTDIAVPAHKFREMFDFYERTFRDNEVSYVLFGHIGDCHLHANIFTDDEVGLSRSLEIYDACIDMGLALGGTVSAEHGIGKLKKKYLLKLYGTEGVSQFRAIKNVLDPQWLLGRSTMFDA